MSDHLKIDYPKELTPAAWNKAKSVLAKKHVTGLGEALKKLESLHNDIQWSQNFKVSHGNIVEQDKHLAAWPAKYAQTFKPLLQQALEVKTTALKAAEVYKKDKMVPSSTVKAAEEVAKQAVAYRHKLEESEGEHAAAMSKVRIDFMSNVLKILKPSVAKGLQKADALIQDIKSYASNPTKKNFFTIFPAKDNNARGYCTQLKQMDQFLVEFPDIRNKVWPASYSLVKELLPGMNDYGANHDEGKFEKLVNVRLKLDGNTEDCWKVHARILLKEVKNVQTFALDCQKLLKLLN